MSATLDRIATALDGIEPASVSTFRKGGLDWTINLATCAEFATVCDRLNVPAKNRGQSGGHHGGRTQHWGELPDVLVMHQCWPHSPCHPGKQVAT